MLPADRSNNRDPIDAVITWVDGNDPDHKAKRLKYSLEPEDNLSDYALVEGRFVETGEIKYSIYSIRKFAPWIRQIYLVTDNQQPGWLTADLQDKLGVRIIDHKVIFEDFPDCLPSFNNMSIGSLLWKIPGLSNKYITFNDDNFIIRPVQREDFFIRNKIIVRGSWHKQNSGLKTLVKRYIKGIINLGCLNLTARQFNHHSSGARFVGFKKKYFETVHAPYSWRIDLQKEFFDNHPQLLAENVRYRFRNNNQHGPSVLFTHYAIKTGNAVFNDGQDSVMIIPRSEGLMDNRKRYESLKQNRCIKFLCFQDMAFLKEINPSEYNEVTDYLDRVILI